MISWLFFWIKWKIFMNRMQPNSLFVRKMEFQKIITSAHSKEGSVTSLILYHSYNMTNIIFNICHIIWLILYDICWIFAFYNQMKASNLFMNSSLAYKICQSEKPGHSGFPYAFWLLLHYITAQTWFQNDWITIVYILIKPVLSRPTVMLEHAPQLFPTFAWCFIRTNGSFCHLLGN